MSPDQGDTEGEEEGEEEDPVEKSDCEIDTSEEGEEEGEEEELVEKSDSETDKPEEDVSLLSLLLFLYVAVPLRLIHKLKINVHRFKNT